MTLAGGLVDRRVMRELNQESELEKQVDKLTKDMGKLCEGQNAAVVIAASMNMIQSCMTYGDAHFQRATAEALRGMANTQLQASGKQRLDA
jgi:hypothetical protein